MKEVRKIYDRTFKEKAVQLSYERTNISELARELDISAPQLYKWRKEYEEFGQGSFPGSRVCPLCRFLALPITFCRLARLRTS